MADFVDVSEVLCDGFKKSRGASESHFWPSENAPADVKAKEFFLQKAIIIVIIADSFSVYSYVVDVSARMESHAG